MAGEEERVNAYLKTVKRLEPEITPIDLPAAAASIAISLRRIADSLESLPERLQIAIQDGIWNATRK